MNIGIAGIHTGIGKTVCSAVICQALGYDYWKPVQAGDLENSDSNFIRDHVTNPSCKIHPERFRLLTPASPHYAASLEKIEIKREDFILPSTKNNLLAETAGGLMSPLAKNFLNIDLLPLLQLKTVLVSNNYLGSINHTLLSWEALRSKGIPLLGIVFVGETVASTEEFILEHTQLKKLFSIPLLKELSQKTIQQFASEKNITLGIE
ncbi:MAG TPA: dethiobiotin synthase [Cytophagales bacterium]|jgi:dethiobiotin synthetase|nr:dethiobiotin synthase [Cytophagales bacterium]